MANIVQKIQEDLTFEKVFLGVMKTPGVKIHRDKFLRNKLTRYYPDSIISEAIMYNPAKAGIERKTINKIAKNVINYETTKVTGLSIAASLPSSGAAVVAVGAATVDIMSYFTFILRVVQELAYLYGFEEFEFNEDNVDSETMNFILVFLGVMFGVQGAETALGKLANSLAHHVAKMLANKALTKGAIYPIVKKIATKVGIRMTKQIFADTVASAIPVVGSLVSGGLTYVAFKPSCIKLKNNLMQYNLSDPNYYRNIII